MATFSYYSYREFGKKYHSDYELVMNEDERMCALPTYVPFSKVRSHRVSSIVSIIDSTERIYIRERNRLNLHKVDFMEQNEYGDLDSLSDKDYDEEDKDVAGIGSLDLGIEPLRLIVLEMNRLHSDVPHFSFDQNSAKAAGLPGYCEYLKGPKSNEPRQRNTARFQAIQQKKKVKNIGKK
jgi:hypothetical protein